MTIYYPFEKLRKIPGIEHVKYVDLYAGSKGNSIRYLSVAPRTNDMKVVGVDNLFCSGEKSGVFVGHTEAICTGSLAVHNAVRLKIGLPLLILPSSIAICDLIVIFYMLCIVEKSNYLKGDWNLILNNDKIILVKIMRISIK